MLKEDQMRSELVFNAVANVSNRYLLVRAASKAMRLLHRPHTRLEDTTNEVLRLFGRTYPIHDVVVLHKPPTPASALPELRRAS
jgi:hypothetical protein